MGLFKKIFGFVGGGKKVNILVVGLDNSGKTTIIERLKPRKAQSQEVVPTVGFRVEEFEKKGLRFMAFDMSGAGRYRTLWEQYYKEAQAIIFVIDCADKLRLVVAKDELDQLLSHGDLKRVPILFLANKKDLPNGLSPVEVAQAMRLDDIRDKPWQIAHCNALSGEGLEAGFDWLAESMK